MYPINKNFYEYLCCPECNSPLELTILIENIYGIKSGNLGCKNCSLNFPIINYIPRFVISNNYSSSFGYEWLKYGKLRSDRYNNTLLIRKTILNRTGWTEGHLKDKLLLECGCGAGNDTEVLLDLGAKVISFDYSNSVEIAYENNKLNSNSLILQADIYKIPLKKEIFDIIYCHRVIQHTPNPEAAFYSIVKNIKKNCEIFLHSYDISIWGPFYYKYILRPLTKRINHRKTHILLKIIGPILYFLVGKLQKIKKFKYLKGLLLIIIPFDNLDYTLESSTLSKKEKYYYSLLNVFDKLTPKFDNPNEPNTIIKWFKNAELKNINLKARNPVIITAVK